MKGRILVMGASGRLGYAAATAFRDAGWRVRCLVRPQRTTFAPPGTEVIEVITREEGIEAAMGCQVVLNALNAPLTEWKLKAAQLNYSAIAAAEAAGATLLFPGNLFNYGSKMPIEIGEDTPMQPSMSKGGIRVEMEQRIREACEGRMRAVVLRAGDFFGGGRGSWFDLVIVKDLPKGRVVYPGPFNVMHEWTYLPDYVQALVQIAERRDEFAAFECFGFPSHPMTGERLFSALEDTTGANFQVQRLSWLPVKTVGRLTAMGRALAEVEYLWREPHRIVGDRLKAALGTVPHTPLNQALVDAIVELFPDAPVASTADSGR